MKIAIISDIHSNLEALTKVLSEIKDVDKVFCLGDIVGYGANPGECLEMIRDRVGLCIAGNHDYGVIGKTDIQYFNSAARQAIIWTRSHISDLAKKYLDSLSLTESYDDMSFTHGVFSFPESWNYIFSLEDAVREFHYMDSSIGFVGHSHIPGVFFEKIGEYGTLENSEFTFEDRVRYIVNCGSVGQPRDGDPRASFCIIDTDDKKVIMHRVAYNVERAREKIIEVGLPESLGDRLIYGR